MTFYSQWMKAPKITQVLWVCGSERALVDDVVRTVKSSVSYGTVNFLSLDAQNLPPKTFWDSLYQRSLLEDSALLILVHNAQAISDLNRLKLWVGDVINSSPNTTVCFISEDDTAPESPAFKSSKVLTVRCSGLSVEDSVAWVRRISPLSDRSARALLEHVAGSLQDAYQVCHKLNCSIGSSALLSLSSDQLKFLISETPSEFVDALMSLDKPRAFITAETLTDDDKYRVVSILEARVSQLARLQSILRSDKLTGRELAKIPGIPYPVVQNLLPVSKFYGRARLLACRQSLTMTDEYHNQGVYEGTLESLIAVW